METGDCCRQVPPYMMLKNSEEKLTGNDQYQGYCADLAQKIAELVQFNYELKMVQDDKFGAKVNGTWNGMVGELISGVRKPRVDAVHCFWTFPLGQFPWLAAITRGSAGRRSLRRSRSFKVTDFGTNRKPVCDFF